MRNILLKEIRLSASALSFFFVLFGLMFFLPGYPVLCGAFFVTLGIFQSFQNAREANDIVFSSLLPIAKQDIVKGKYLFTCFIEICGALLMTVAVILRMTVLSEVSAYLSNALMNANLFALGMAFIVFALFNLIFVGGFFKTAYKFGRPFIVYTVAVFLLIGVSEALHHFPGLSSLNAFGTEHFAVQLLSLIIGIAVYLIITYLSCRKACRCFDMIDL